MTKVSVALCTHFGGKFIEEQILSILNQSRAPDEIVLSDDASKDDTVAIVERLVSKNKSISLLVIRNDEPLGVVKNFEQAVHATSGDIIMLCDQDDSWYSDRVDRTLDEFSSHPELQLLFSDVQLVAETGEVLPQTLFEALRVSKREERELATNKIFNVLIRRNLALGASMSFRRNLLDVAIPFPDSWIHDEWLAIVASAGGSGAVKAIQQTLLAYRQHGGNQIGVRKTSMRSKFSRLGESRTARNERLLAASQALVSRLSETTVQASFLEIAKSKLRHEQARSLYPESRLSRISPVLREVRSGRYQEVGHGPSGVIADLLQPV